MRPYSPANSARAGQGGAAKSPTPILKFILSFRVVGNRVTGSGPRPGQTAVRVAAFPRIEVAAREKENNNKKKKNGGGEKEEAATPNRESTTLEAFCNGNAGEKGPG